MKERKLKSNNLYLNIVISGLKFWVKTQCKSIDTLSLSINSSDSNLVKGRISGVSVVANKVDFKGLKFEEVKLESSPIKINIDLLKGNNKITLKENFRINGEISFKEETLTHILKSCVFPNVSKVIASTLLKHGPGAI